MRALIHSTRLFFVAMLNVLASIVPPRATLPRLVKFRQDPFVKRGHAKVIGGGHGMASVFGGLNVGYVATVAALFVFAHVAHAHGAPGGMMIVGSIVGSRQIDSPNVPSTYSVPKSVSVQLPRESLVYAFFARLRATADVTGGTGAGDVRADATFRLISRVLFTTSKRLMWAINGHTIGKVNKFLQPQVETQDPPSTDAAGTSEAIEGNYYLPAHLPRADRPETTMAPLYALDNPQLTVELAAPSEMFTTDQDATKVELNDVTFDLFEHPVENLPKYPAKNLYGLELINNQEYIVPANEANHKFYLENIEPGEEIARIFVETFNDGEYEDGIVDNVMLVVNGEDKFKTTPFSVQQDRNMRNYQLAQRETGVIAIDAAEDTRVGDLWLRRDGSRPYLQAALTKASGVTKVVVTTFTVKRAEAARK